MIISNHRGHGSLVRITNPNSSNQTRVGFSASLVQEAGLSSISGMEIDFEEKQGVVTFFSSSSPKSFPMMRDGGNAVSSRAIYLRRGMLPLVSGEYVAKVVHVRGQVRIQVSVK